jgi:cell division protein FtsI/penicillin-binding protein 2
LLRREALATLLAGPAWVRAGTTLEPYFEGQPGAGLLLDIAARKLRAAYQPDSAARQLLPPGSTLKPFVLSALLRLNRIQPDEKFACPGTLSIAGRELPCSHPKLPEPVNVAAALTYSCNCFVANFARRFRPGELYGSLVRYGLSSPPGLFPEEAAGRIRAGDTPESIQLQSLGEENVLVTPAALAMAYRNLALNAAPAIREGLEGAVAVGTAQRAQVAGWKIAGKTGTIGASSPAGRIAWFAGFAPSQAPGVVVVVMLHARSGGADAAPVAGRILAAYKAGRL